MYTLKGKSLLNVAVAAVKTGVRKLFVFTKNYENWKYFLT